MTTAVLELVNQAEKLSDSENIELVMALLELSRDKLTRQNSLVAWRDIRGIYPGYLKGEDAQGWVNRLRDEWDERDPDRSIPA